MSHSPRPRRGASVLLCALLLASPGLSAADDPAPTPTPTPTPTPQPEQQGEQKDPPPVEVPPRVRHEKALQDTLVHFDFKRAPLGDILRALSKASGVPVTLGYRARKVLERRKFKIKYVADRRGDQVLVDLCKAATLDFLVRDKGVLVDLPGRIKQLREQAGVSGGGVKLTPADIAKALETKSLSLAARERPLDTVLRFLRKETGIPFVRLSEERKKDAPPLRVTLTVTSVPLGQLLDKILHPLGLDWMQQGRAVLVASREAIAEQRKPAPKDDAEGEEKKGEGAR